VIAVRASHIVSSSGPIPSYQQLSDVVGDWAYNRPLTSEEHSGLRGVLVSLVIGATAGALLLIHAPFYAPVLPLVVTALIVAIAAKVFRNRDDASEIRRRS
jgi:uncharacterized protein YacL